MSSPLLLHKAIVLNYNAQQTNNNKKKHVKAIDPYKQYGRQVKLETIVENGSVECHSFSKICKKVTKETK